MVTKWIEWIEPVNIAARHPFAFARCRHTWQWFNRSMPRADRSDVDYVLIHSGKSLFRSRYNIHLNGTELIALNNKKEVKPDQQSWLDRIGIGKTTFFKSVNKKSRRNRLKKKTRISGEMKMAEYAMNYA